MPAVCRFQDFCSGHAGFPPRKNIEASNNVYVNNRGWHRINDKWDIHCDGNSCHDSILARGSSSVFVNSKNAGRIGDPVQCNSAVVTGSENVYCG